MPYVNLALASTIRTNLKKNPQAAKECQSHYQGRGGGRGGGGGGGGGGGDFRRLEYFEVAYLPEAELF